MKELWVRQHVLSVGLWIFVVAVYMLLVLVCLISVCPCVFLLGAPIQEQAPRHPRGPTIGRVCGSTPVRSHGAQEKPPRLFACVPWVLL